MHLIDSYKTINFYTFTNCIELIKAEDSCTRKLALQLQKKYLKSLESMVMKESITIIG